MEFPTINVKQKSRQMLDAFLGYNHNLRIGDNEFYDMRNMTSDYYPVLAPRGKRGIYQGDTLSEGDILADGIIAKEKLCYTHETNFVIGNHIVNMELEPGPKDLISMGAYVIIMPDRKYINTSIKEVGEYEYGDIDAEFTTKSTVTFQLCTLTGDAYENPTVSATAPSNPSDNQLWIDTSSSPHSLKKYSEATAMWVSIATTYIKVSATDIGKKFQRYDGVKIDGIKASGLTQLNGSHALWDCGDDYIIITGILDNVTTQSVSQGAITVSRKMPDMDFIVESNNRLWGCKYGRKDDGSFVNEIYACKQGDFKNWNCFMNLSTDSYVVSCGSDGPFTGAITHMGYPLFFKENCIHKVYGDYPANFRLQNTICRGVQKGSHKSLAIVNETLFYKSNSAVCAFDGSLPVEISSALGDVPYSDAVAGAYGNKYYICMKSSVNYLDNAYHLFVYDTAKGMWHKEDEFQAQCFCSYHTDLYAIDSNTKRIVAMLGTGVQDDPEVPWMVETGLMGMSIPDMKYITRLLLRVSLGGGAAMSVSVQYDSIGDWKTVFQARSTTVRSFAVPIRLRRCDHFRIRIEGEGKCRIYSITKTIEQGSDIS
jgi:hypothetical protein